MADPREEIRSRIDLVELISDYTRLERAGKNYRGLCPFHSEKTPSFHVSPALGRFHCFGCGASGDHFAFIERIEGIGFRDALQKLAERAGIELTPERVDYERADTLERLKRPIAAAQFFFRQSLKKNPPARDYILGRGIKPEIANQFGLGFAPDQWDAMTTFFQNNHVSLTDAQIAGLVEEGKQGWYDRFRNRLMFPIHDQSGRVVAFGGRVMGEGEPKYLNSPETPLFEKRKIFYGWHLARAAILRERTALIAEGYLDLIMLHQLGFSHALATLGTAFSEDHAARLKRMVDRVYLLFDSDEAGAKAAMRSAEILQAFEIPTWVVQLPPGEDPDSLLKARGADALKTCIEEAVRAPMFALQRVLGRDLEHVETLNMGERAALIQSALPIIAAVPNAIERESYLEWLAPFAPSYAMNPQGAESALRDDLNRLLRRKTKFKRKDEQKPTEEPANPIPAAELQSAAIPRAIRHAEQTLIRALCEPDLRKEAMPFVSSYVWRVSEYHQIAQLWQENQLLTAHAVADTLIASLSDETLQQKVTALLLKDAEPLNRSLIADCIAYLQRQQKRARRTELTRRISKGEIAPEDPLMQEYLSLLAELKEKPSNG